MRGTLSCSQQLLTFLYSCADALELTCIEMFRKYFRRNENGKVVEQALHLPTGIIKFSCKVTCQQAQVGGKGTSLIALLILDPGSRRGCVVWATPRPLYPSERDPIPIVQEDGWALAVGLNG